MNRPLVSIIIPCRNEAECISPCLDSILSQTCPAGGFEIIVADGMSDDGTRDIVHDYCRNDSRLRMIDNPQQIVSTGLNAAINAADGDIIIRMDAHRQYADDYIAQCVSVLQQTQADNVGGPWIARGDGYRSCAIAAAFQSPFAVGGARGHDPQHEGPVDTVYLGCWRRDAFQRFGAFHTELVRNQDDEFNLRVTRQGGVIRQSPKIRSWYRPRNSLTALFRQYSQYGYWKVRVIQLHKTPASLRHLVPASFLVLLAALGILSFYSSKAGAAVVGLLAMYVSAVLIASMMTAGRTGWKLLPMLPLVFVCFHVGYGYGFLYGIWDFVIRGTRRGSRFSRLTREVPWEKTCP